MNNNYKKVESILLSENDDILDNINKLLDANYADTMKLVFNCLISNLFTLSESEITLLLDNIELIVLNQDPDNFPMLINLVKNTNNSLTSIISKNPSNFLKTVKFNLVDLNRKMNEIKLTKDKVNLYELYYDLIFNDRRIKIINSVIKSGKMILNLRNKDNRDLFSELLIKYLDASNDEDIYYYTELIEMFLNSNEKKIIEKRKEEYLEILSKYSDREDVKKLISKINAKNDYNFNSLADKYHIRHEVHDSIMEEINNFSFDSTGRKFIDGNFTTIDEAEADCLDDAFALIPNGDGSYYYYIAITDIPSLIPYKSLTFYDAYKKVESQYLFDRILPLYHESISKDKCSLLPGVNKHVILYKYFVDPSFHLNPDSLEIIKGNIVVNNRLSYSNVNKRQNVDDETLRMIDKIALITERLKLQNNIKEEYRRIENAIKSDATYHHSMYIDKSSTANIIQESMLLVNSSAPKFFSDNGLIYTYRNHKIINDKNANVAVKKLLTSCKENMSEEEYENMTKLIKEIYLTAHYSTECRGHEGLGYKYYSHSSSAARRFDDSFNQYLTYMQIFNPISDKAYYELEIMSRGVVDYLNERKKEIGEFQTEYNSLKRKVKKIEKK